MSRRRLRDEERTLWRGVTRSVKPLRADVAVEAALPPTPIGNARVKPEPVPVEPGSTAASKSLPPLSTMPRRARHRVSRGVVALDGRLDLHGMTQAEAHGALLSFLRTRQLNGCRLVLIITGKGARQGSGVLRRLVPLWLALPELRDVVIGFEPAAISHGGEGALYVTLRRSAHRDG